MKTILTSQEIENIIRQLADKINGYYASRQNEEPILIVGILNGAFIFLADLARHLTFPVEIEFIRTSSYGNEKTSSGTVRLIMEPQLSPKGRHVLIVDDLIDTGQTLAFAQEYFTRREAADINIAVLLDKKKKRTCEVFCRFIGTEVEDYFLGGYGLDGGHFYSHSPNIFIT